jgi:NDP-4-keto-2,6-dideoxyhexose 3-C-methyltransferase
MYQEVTRCRICDNTYLASILDLGEQSLTGVFPKSPADRLTRGPLELVKCHGGGAVCGLVQLRHTYDLGEMYGDNYGYRSSLNRAMADHLAGIARDVQALAPLAPGDIVIDIGSNDGTLLGCYPAEGPELVGIDPTARKFRQYYKPHIQVIEDFFTAAKFRAKFGSRKARIVTSIAMFYDLPRPMDFVRDVAAVLADDGIWHLEQSYLPAMMAANAYDTVCHEHLEFYALSQIRWMTDRAGLRIIDVKCNDTNGGSFAVTVAKAGGPHRPTAAVEKIAHAEESLGLATMAPFEAFRRRVFAHRDELAALLARLKDAGETVIGYGASTKGNVLLQFCGIGPELLPYIAEVNEDKFGRYTPGTGIPIIPEAVAQSMKPAYMLVLPWHFRRGILDREQAYLRGGGKFIFPLPEIDVVGG